MPKGLDWAGAQVKGEVTVAPALLTGTPAGVSFEMLAVSRLPEKTLSEGSSLTYSGKELVLPVRLANVLDTPT